MYADSLRRRKYVLNRAEIFMKKEIMKQLTVSTHSTRDKSSLFFFFLRFKHLLVYKDKLCGNSHLCRRVMIFIR